MVNLVDSNYCEMSWPTKTLIFVTIWLLISCIAADAAKPPANIIKYKQPDGSVVLLAPHGDEYFSYYTTPDGSIVTPGGDSFFYYATLDRNGIHSSGVRITLQNNTKSSTVASSENLHVLSDLRQKRMSGLQGISVRASSALPESGPGGKKLTYLVIPVQFKDVKFTLENPKGFFNDFFNCKGYSYDGATGSVADYFNDNFGGAYDFSFVISDMVTLDKELAYYGGRTEIAADANIEELVVSACEAVSKSGADLRYMRAFGVCEPIADDVKNMLDVITGNCDCAIYGCTYDDNCLTHNSSRIQEAYNGVNILLDAYRVFGDKKYLEFLLQNMRIYAKIVVTKRILTN